MVNLTHTLAIAPRRKYPRLRKATIMRKCVAIEFISLDGVIQAPGGPEEDTSGGFTRGGWIAEYGDPQLGKFIRDNMSSQFDLLLGRKTYDIWAPYWPLNDAIWHNANLATKYVASSAPLEPNWQPNVWLNGDVATQVAQAKQTPGNDLHVYGSCNLLHTLFEHDLVDELRLMIHPIVLGQGKRLFAPNGKPTAFTLVESSVCDSGVIIARYQLRQPANPA